MITLALFAVAYILGSVFCVGGGIYAVIVGEDLVEKVFGLIVFAIGLMMLSFLFN
jgi:hypothetical protein